MAFAKRTINLHWQHLPPTNTLYLQTLPTLQSHSLHTICAGNSRMSSFFNSNYTNHSNHYNYNHNLGSSNNRTNDKSSLFYQQIRTARYRPKRLILPNMRRKYKKHYNMKYHQFSDDTLHSISAGQDSFTKVTRSDFMNKHHYRAYPSRKVMRLWSDILDTFLWLPVSDAGLRQIQKAGTLDRYILCTPCKYASSRLVERLRYRMNRVLERKEDEILARAQNGDETALGIAYKIIKREEKWDENALKVRNSWLRLREGKREMKETKWKREELERRIQLIQEGKMPQKLPEQAPMWQQLQPYFNDLSKIQVE